MYFAHAIAMSLLCMVVVHTLSTILRWTAENLSNRQCVCSEGRTHSASSLISQDNTDAGLVKMSK